MLRHFFTEALLRRREAPVLETSRDFSIFLIHLKLWKVHVFGDSLSRAPKMPVNVFKALDFDLFMSYILDVERKGWYQENEYSTAQRH